MNFSNIGSSNVREVNLIMYREVRKKSDQSGYKGTKPTQRTNQESNVPYTKYGKRHGDTIGIESLKAIHDTTKLDLTISLLFIWCIDSDLNIQLMSFTLYMTWVH